MDFSAVVRGFRKLYSADRDAGRVRPLDEYQKLFAGHETAIAGEFRKLEDEAPRPAPPQPAPPPTEQKEIGPYKLLRELGRGGQGQVTKQGGACRIHHCARGLP